MAEQTKFIVSIDARAGQSHRVYVTIRALDGHLPSQLEFPVWTPGSYLVREYSRHITSFVGGTKTSKNTWRLNPNTREVSYEVYAFEKTVRTSYLDANYAVFVGATLLPLLPASFDIKLIFPAHWTLAASALPLRKKAPGQWQTQARDIDHWIDSPIIAAAPGYGGQTRYKAKGISHELAWVGTECNRPLAELSKDFAKISETVIQLFGGVPFKRYTTLLQFGHKLYGGLEHRDSQLSQYDGGSLGDKKEYENFLRLFAHEYFHAWNVKSLRPEALGPFDYTRENYTQDLWFAEGLTDYFDEMIPYLAKITNADSFWKARLKGISMSLDGLPAHRRRSLAESSFDAWIRYYRPDEDSANSDVSYYVKGSQLGLCWDAHLQKKSRGRWTLAKLMKEFWREFGIGAEEDLRSAKPGFLRSELLQFAETKTKILQKDLVEAWVTRRAPLPWREALAQFGVRFKETISDHSQHYLGAQVVAKNGALYVTKVFSGGSAERAGLATGDEILAIGDDRCADLDSLPKVLKSQMGRSRRLNFLTSRQNKMIHLEVEPQRHLGLGQELEFEKLKHV